MFSKVINNSFPFNNIFIIILQRRFLLDKGKAYKQEGNMPLDFMFLYEAYSCFKDMFQINNAI